jgi:hypothetical protein
MCNDHIHLWRNVVCLSCWNFLDHNVPLPHTWYHWKAFNEEIFWDSFLLFRLMMQEVLAIEQFCWKIFNKVKTKNLRVISGIILVLLESLWWVGFLGGNFVILRAKVGKILNFASFLSLKIQLNFESFSYNWVMWLRS